MGGSLRQRLAGGPALEALYEIAVAAAGGARDLSAVTKLATDQACELLGAQGASIFVWNEATGLLHQLVISGAQVFQMTVRSGEGLLGEAFKTCRPALSEDYQRHPNRLSTAIDPPIRGAVVVPMMFDDAPIGTLGVWSTAKRVFSDDEVALLSEFASHLAPAIEAARSAEQRDEQERVFRTLHQVAVAAASTHETGALSQLAVAKAQDLLGSRSAFLSRWDDEEEVVRPLADTDPRLGLSWTARSGEGAAGVTFERGQALVIDDYENWPNALPSAQNLGIRTVLAVPLAVHDRTMGVLGVRWASKRRVSDAERERLALLASQVAPALEVAELLEASANQVRGLSSLHEVAVAASGVLDPSALARLMVDHARDLLQVESAVLRWWDPAAGVLRLLASNDPHPRHQVPEVTPEKGVIGAAFRRQEPVIVYDYGADSPSVPWAVDDRVITAMAVPLMVGLRPVGAVAVATYKPHRYDAAQIRLLTLCAAQVAPAVEAARLAEERERQSRTLRAMQQLATAASGVLEPAVLAQLAIDKARELLAADTAGLAWWDPAAKVLRLISDHLTHSSSLTQEAGDGLAGLAFQRGEPVLVDDYQNWQDSEPGVRRLGYRSGMAVPLMVHDRAVGSLLVRSRGRRHYNPEEVQLLSLIAAQVAPALEAARLHTDLAGSERRFRSLYEAMACGVIVRSPQGTVVEVNQAACHILEATREEVMADLHGWKRTRDDGSTLPAGDRAYEIAVRTRRPVKNYVARYEKPNRNMWIQIDCVPVLNTNGEIERVVSSFIDITSVKLGEAARRENEAKSRFLAAMSHELRTPLNSILGFAQLLQRAEFGDLDNRQTRYVDNIASSGRHLLDLVNDVLDLSKVAAGQMEIFNEDFEITALLREALVKVRPLADAKLLNLELHSRSRPWIHGDRRRVEQVVWNLLSNAIKFTPDGGTVEVGARAVNGEVKVVVIDSGIGVAPEQHERIFEEFTQVDDGRSRSHQGTGLGLPLSRRLVQLMGGQLTLQSKPGEGSTFTVTLPRAQPTISESPAAGD